jgi:hypothetical protein
MSGWKIMMEAGGLDAALRLTEAVPDELVPPALHRTMLDLLEIGKLVMMRSILETSRTEKATGEIADSIEGYLTLDKADPQSQTYEYTLEIGSNLSKAFYASQDIRPSWINRPVQVMPGRWRFVGLRPFMPGHFFLEATAAAMNIELHNTLGEWLKEESYKIQRSVDQLQEG